MCKPRPAPLLTLTFGGDQAKTSRWREALAVLSDPRKRREYDEDLARPCAIAERRSERWVRPTEGGEIGPRVGAHRPLRRHVP